MKRVSFLVVAILLVFSFLAGCSNVVGFNPADSGWMDGVPADHNVVLGVGVGPSPSISRSVLPSSWASVEADTYTLFVYNKDGVYSGNLFSSTGVVSLAVPEGTYSAILLGGKRFNVHNHYGLTYMFGSQKFENVVIKYGDRTELNLNLETVSAALWAPPEIAYSTSTHIEFSYRLGGAHSNLHIQLNDWTVNQVIVSSTGSETYGTSGEPKANLTPEIFTNSSHVNRVVPINVIAQNSSGNTDPSEVNFRLGLPGIYLADINNGYNATTFRLTSNGVDWSFPGIHSNLGYRFDYPSGFGNSISVPVMAESELTIGIGWTNGR